MSDILFIGQGTEVYPYRLLGLATLAAPEGSDDLSWVETVARGGHRLILVSESVQRSQPEGVTRLAGRIDPASALTVIPDTGGARSEHLRFLRARTMRAMGVDTWTQSHDHGPGASP